MTLRARLLLGAGTVLVVVLGAVGVWVRGALEAPRAAFEQERLRRDFDLVQILLEESEPEPESDADRPFRDLARDLGQRLDLRVTFVSLDGRVLGDSGIPDGDVRLMEFHGDRPEIRSALEQRGVHELERMSPTQGIFNLYVAGRVMIAGRGDEVVLRLSAPKDQLLGTYGRVPTFLVLLGAAGLLALSFVIPMADRRLRFGIEDLEMRVQALSDGRIDSDADRVTGRGSLPGRSTGQSALPVAVELQPLSGALDRLSVEVSGRVREMDREQDEVLALVESIAEGVLALTEDARVLRMNQAAATLLEILLPSPFAPIGTLVRNPGLRDYLEEAVVLPLPPREFTIGDRTLRVSTSLLDIGGAVVTLLDVTDLRRMEQIRRDFVANASHELKTPLTAMRGFSETLLEGDVPEALRIQFLSSIRSNTVRMQNLVDDLLDLSRIESGTWTLQEEEVEIAPVAHDVWRESVPSGDEAGARFQVTGDSVALADAQALHQIFRNLLDNARRYTPAGGNIAVLIEPKGPEVLVSVSDSGAGIPSAALPRIFERFYRVDAGRDRGVGGTGLGLSIVRHLVTAMGGEVWAESRLGQGTTIRFTLPRVETPEALALERNGAVT